MSFEKKLYDYEVNPPQEMWAKLSSALDELHFENSFRKKLNAINAAPPIENWGTINKVLKTETANTVTDQLYNLTETPPANIWSQIEDQLVTDDFDSKFSKYLSELEVTPPQGSWAKIKESLYEQTPVVPVQKNYNRVYRYAAAAIIVGVIAWSGIRYFTNTKVASSNIEVAKKENTLPATPSTPQTQSVENAPANIAASQEQPDATAEKIALHKKEKRTNSLPTDKSLNPAVFAASTIQENHLESDEIIADANSLQKNKSLAASSNTDPTATRYLVYLNDQGSLMKISKKMADLKCIYTKDGEVSQSALAKLDRTLCNDIVSCWQEKLALAPINLSFNPLEMADILK